MRPGSIELGRQHIHELDLDGRCLHWAASCFGTANLASLGNRSSARAGSSGIPLGRVAFRHEIQPSA